MGDLVYNQNDILLLGSGGHAKVIIDAIKISYPEYRIIGLTDVIEERLGKEVLGIPILGTDIILDKQGLRKVFIAVGMTKVSFCRLDTYNHLVSTGFELVNIIHKKSIISDMVTIGCGNAILAGVIINADALIGNACIINTGSIIEHDCIIGNNVHVAPGAKLSGNAIIKDNSIIGIGASVIQGVQIGKNCIIGAGSAVISNIPDNSTAVGVPAKVIKRGC